MSKRCLLWLLIGVSGAVLPAVAQETTSHEARDVERETVRHQATDRQALRREQAEAWGLTEKEWTRYETLMQQQRGIWSPNLDPIMTLGVEARTEEERQRYAELLVEVERDRVERELAFQRAYDEAWERLYPDAMPVESFTSRSSSSPFDGRASSEQPSRLGVVVAIDGCSACDATVQRLVRQGVLMDIFVIDSGGDDMAIRRWASRLDVPPEWVRRGLITLNHGDELSVGIDQLPQVLPRG
ncbi:hypothetical protein L861_06470 [Litchfieldella anticariensis FP35 = DSM 16096]|uniref:Integrating conjugative element protein n=1 Tax=Litchfieldella anticariensis (strain DSM 16096 / CECT 5854 / CIP 108499 / LMG 22089 / FP35) TaxID=1121939 RepID=S2KJL1_LITA3|nr:TIGR03759 family integrating conjugative element protein [Halomonas anticariensis]EPC00578.1 hypothetical protein L861_06470 [Halomonas anticariensis FP35 = DSM 16096]